jgi:chitinase
MKNMKWLLGVSLALALSACGGGGSDCSLVGGAFCSSSEKAENKAPVARAGSSQSVLLADGLVKLDGSASTDANGDALTYQWSLLSKPGGSLASLIEPSSVKPSFLPDKLGAYVFSLVVADGKLSSDASLVTVLVSELNAPPVADAGPDQSVLLGSVVTLDGRDSSDANKADVLTFAWTLNKPDGTSQNLTGIRPTFTASLTGVYLASLLVSDGVSVSNIDTVRVQSAAANVAPVARISALTNVAMGSQVQLSGLASSDANNDALTYKWALLRKPTTLTGARADSVAVLSGVGLSTPVFTADVAGIYVVSLVVSDGQLSSEPVTAAVTVSDVNDVTGLDGQGN